MHQLAIGKTDRSYVTYVEGTQRDNRFTTYTFQVTDTDGNPINLNGAIVTFEGNLNNGNYYAPSTEATIVDYDKGIFSYQFTDEAFSVSGEYRKAKFLVKRSNEQRYTQDFRFVVTSAPDLDGEVAQVYEGRLEKELEKFEDATSQIADKVAKVETEGDKAIADIDSHVVQATTSINKVVTDVQVLGANESAKITAVLPALQQQIADTKANSESIKHQLEQTTMPTRPKMAWANSADGSKDFTTVKPNSNLIIGSNVSITSQQYRIKKYALSASTLPTDRYKIQLWGNLGNGRTQFGVYSTDGQKWFADLIKQSDGYYTSDFKSDVAIKDIVVYQFPNNPSLPASTINKIKLSYPDDIYTPNPQDDQLGSIMQYVGDCYVSSTNPVDYRWQKSDEYWQYQIDQLSKQNAVTGGTL